MKITYKEKPYTQLHPELRQVLDIVHAKRPLLEYQVETVDQSGDATSVNVYQHGQNLGEINACFRKYSESKGMNVRMFRVWSPMIRKERGDRNAKTFKHAKDAAKCVIEVFAKKPLKVLGEELIEHVNSAVHYCVYQLERNFNNSWQHDNTLACAYFLKKVQGYDVPVPEKYSKQVTEGISKKYDEFEVGQNVSKHMQVRNGYAIRIMQDETYLVANCKNAEHTEKYNSTYDMPQFLQEKLTILKVLGYDQCAADIGVKFRDGSDTVYFVVGGETVVQ